MMVDMRTNPPKTILGSPVVKINDFLSLEETNVVTGVKTTIEQDKSNVLQFFTEDGTKVSVRPSGTEPKIKFYMEAKGKMGCRNCYADACAKADETIAAMKQAMGI